MFNFLYALAFALNGMLSALISPWFLVPTVFCGLILAYSVYDDPRFDSPSRIKEDKGYD